MVSRLRSSPVRRALGTMLGVALIAVALFAVAAPGHARAGVAAAVSGTVRDAGRQGLPGMRIQALPVGATACVATTGCASTYSVTGGRFALSDLSPGTYDVEVVDGLQTVLADVLHVPASGGRVVVRLTLGEPAVPDGTRARLAQRALGWLNAQRRRAGVPADVVLNPRWSRECGAHDAYELANDTLQPAENPAASGYSLGGAWAGLSSDLAQGRWTAAASPWQDAPVNLLALLAPSLSVTGIDDGPARQCAITFPGMLRTPPLHDTIDTVPGAGARHVPTSELARESPYTPVQFVGLPASRRTGRELFVYLNLARQLGQASVDLTAATLTRDGHRLPVRWVDSRTRELGPDLAGAILIPLRPLAAHATYRAAVSVLDGSRVLRHTWSFTTG